MSGFLASSNELVGTGLVQLTVTSDELPPQRQLSNLASRVGLSHSCQEARRELNRPGSDGGSQSMEDESHGSTEEVPRRVA
jgi:hypothetical protein